MTDRLSFTVMGEPVGKGRARATARIYQPEGQEPRAIISMHTPKPTIEAEKRVRAEFARMFPEHRKWTGAVMLRLTAIFAIPKSFTAAQRETAIAGKLYCTKKPDKDNIEKLICDALNDLAWFDDAQVQGGGVKLYGLQPRIDVTIQHLKSEDAIVSPGDLRREKQSEQPQAQLSLRPPVKPKANSKKYPPALQARIDAALGRKR